MNAETQCMFHKFGHCKLGSTCLRYHAAEVCNDESCDITLCSKRHPKACKFFKEYKRCKFSECCSFSHDIVVCQNQNDFNTMKTKIAILEAQAEKNDGKINGLNEIVAKLQEDMKLLKAEIMGTISEVSTTVITEATKSLVNIFKQRQDQFEKSNNLQLEKIEVALTKLLHPAASMQHSSPLSPKQATSMSSLQDCTIRGEAISSANALKIHTRTAHKPGP